MEIHPKGPEYQTWKSNRENRIKNDEERYPDDCFGTDHAQNRYDSFFPPNKDIKYILPPAQCIINDNNPEFLEDCDGETDFWEKNDYLCINGNHTIANSCKQTKIPKKLQLVSDSCWSKDGDKEVWYSQKENFPEYKYRFCRIGDCIYIWMNKTRMGRNECKFDEETS